MSETKFRTHSETKTKLYIIQIFMRKLQLYLRRKFILSWWQIVNCYFLHSTLSCVRFSMPGTFQSKICRQTSTTFRYECRIFQ
jgi:hypothetical protein